MFRPPLENSPIDSSDKCTASKIHDTVRGDQRDVATSDAGWRNDDIAAFDCQCDVAQLQLIDEGIEDSLIEHRLQFRFQLVGAGDELRYIPAQKSLSIGFCQQRVNLRIVESRKHQWLGIVGVEGKDPAAGDFIDRALQLLHPGGGIDERPSLAIHLGDIHRELRSFILAAAARIDVALQRGKANVAASKRGDP